MCEFELEQVWFYAGQLETESSANIELACLTSLWRFFGLRINFMSTTQDKMPGDMFPGGVFNPCSDGRGPTSPDVLLFMHVKFQHRFESPNSAMTQYYGANTVTGIECHAI